MTYADYTSGGMMFFAEYNPVGCGKEEERESIQHSAVSIQPKN
jgi:hypothetical protein